MESESYDVLCDNNSKLKAIHVSLLALSEQIRNSGVPSDLDAALDFFSDQLSEISKDFDEILKKEK